MNKNTTLIMFINKILEKIIENLSNRSIIKKNILMLSIIISSIRKIPQQYSYDKEITKFSCVYSNCQGRILSKIFYLSIISDN